MLYHNFDSAVYAVVTQYATVQGLLTAAGVIQYNMTYASTVLWCPGLCSVTMLVNALCIVLGLHGSTTASYSEVHAVACHPIHADALHSSQTCQLLARFYKHCKSSQA
jgi:hypothetical protein